MTMGRFFGLLLSAIVIAALGYGVSYWYPFPVSADTPPDRPPANELPEAPTRIEAQGRLEPATGTLAVGAFPGEQIVALNARVGMSVQAGDELAVLGSQKIREAEHQLAWERMKIAEAQLKSELTIGQLRIEAAKLSERQAEARRKEIPPADLARVAEQRRDLAVERLQKLEQLRDNPATRDAITDTELQQQRLLIKQIEAELKQNQDKLDAAGETQLLATEAARLDSKMALSTHEGLTAASPLVSLRQTAELARLARDATQVLAPRNGTILEVYAREGERVANTPILLMADLSNMVCIAEVHEANLRGIEVVEEDGKLVPAKDCSVTIRSNALDKQLSGNVIEVGRLIGAPALREPNPLAHSDRRTAKVTIELDDASTELARRFVHLQVNVTIQLKPTDGK